MGTQPQIVTKQGSPCSGSDSNRTLCVLPIGRQKALIIRTQMPRPDTGRGDKCLCLRSEKVISDQVNKVTKELKMAIMRNMRTEFQDQLTYDPHDACVRICQ